MLGKIKAKKLLMAFFKQNKVQTTQNNVQPNNVLKINKSKDGGSLSVDGGKKSKLGNALDAKDKKNVKKTKKRPGMMYHFVFNT